MPAPVTSVRVAPENRDVVREVVRLLNTGRGNELRRMLGRIEEQPLGAYRSAEAGIADAVNRIVAQLDPVEVWLFGSRARGDHRPDSDIDLLVVLPDEPEGRGYTLADARRPVLGGGAPVDIFPIRHSAFEHEPDALGGLVRTAWAEGRRLYP
jgi:predicted nucleotidyltransferase